MTLQVQSRPRRVLVADDDAGCREAVVEIFERDGYAPHAAGCGWEAVELARSIEFHLTVLDMHMPDITGLETFRQLRRIHLVLPGVIVTAEASEDLENQVLAVGAVALLLKPLRADALRAVVSRIFGAEEGEDTESSRPSGPPFRTSV